MQREHGKEFMSFWHRFGLVFMGMRSVSYVDIAKHLWKLSIYENIGAVVLNIFQHVYVKLVLL